MKRLSIVIVVLCFVFSLNAMPSNYPSSQNDAPFGLKWGASLGDVYRNCIMTDLELGEVSQIVDVVPPEPSYLFEDYSVYVGIFGLTIVEAKTEYSFYEKSQRNTGGVFDAVAKARELVSDNNMIYYLLSELYGLPTTKETYFNSLSSTDTYQKLFDYTWSNSYITIEYYAYLEYDSDEFFDDTIYLTLSYSLTSDGRSKVGELQILF